jgi:hypothetical protein
MLKDERQIESVNRKHLGDVTGRPLLECTPGPEFSPSLANHLNWYPATSSNPLEITE